MNLLRIHKGSVIKLFFLLLSVQFCFAQIDSNSVNSEIVKKTRNFYGIGFIPSRAKNIHGIALGPIGSEIFCDKAYTQRINGLGIQLIGQGILQVFYIGHTPFKTFYKQPVNSDDSLVEFDAYLIQIDTSLKRVLYNGLLISPFGTLSDQVNGISISAWMSIGKEVNGISANLLWNLIFKLKGISLGIVNDQFILKGIQIGLFNRTYKLKGIQVGLWNKNEKRSLPIINWNFK